MRHRRGDDQHLPLRHLQSGTGRLPCGRARPDLGLRSATALNKIDRIRPSRRSLLKGAGALVVGFHLAPKGALAQAAATPAQRPRSTPGSWSIRTTGSCCAMARSRWARGRAPACGQMIAEELHCDWSRIERNTSRRPELARNRAWGNFLTAGARASGRARTCPPRRRRRPDHAHRGRGQPMGVGAAECSARDSVVTHAPTGRTLRYGQLAAAAARLTPPNPVPLKDPREWTVIGSRSRGSTPRQGRRRAGVWRRT